MVRQELISMLASEVNHASLGSNGSIAVKEEDIAQRVLKRLLDSPELFIGAWLAHEYESEQSGAVMDSLERARMNMSTTMEEYFDSSAEYWKFMVYRFLMNGRSEKDNVDMWDAAQTLYEVKNEL
jgi:hypothetical protein